MANFTAADTIRILVATDSHVGYNERDAERGDDSWRTFHEVMSIARERDVDMVLHAGDLFHENKPSTKTMKQVMQSLRMNCLGEKPCELELLSDASEQFGGLFDHVNYEDLDINVAIPVFAIHGNHDDPSGSGHLSALDILQTSGLINYYGRTPEADRIDVKPILLQKGNTKLALYGMSNVRDERLFRTFRDGNVKFYRPGTQTEDWFNLLAVHQNHHAYTDTGFLPETFLPDFMDLIVWGHEHECKINPSKNPETGFHVIQPGSSVATSLVAGEAVTKYVSILTLRGRDFTTENIRLKTVRPFVVREIALSDAPQMRKIMHKDENRTEITRYLDGIIQEMLEEADQQWREGLEETGEDSDAAAAPPKPLIRLRVEYSAPEEGRFDIDNPQRFSNRFSDRVANRNDVVQFHRRKKAERKAKIITDLPDEDLLAQFNQNSIKVDKLVQDFLNAQSLKVLPQNCFGDAINLFIEKNDKHALDTFVQDSLKGTADQFLEQSKDNDDELNPEEVEEMMANYKLKMEEAFARGEKKKSSANRRPRPMDWDSEEEGTHWIDSLQSIVHSDPDEYDEENGAEEGFARSKGKATGTSKRGRGGKAAGTTTRVSRSTAETATKKAPTKSAAGRGKKRQVFEESDEDSQDNDVIMLDDDESEEDRRFQTRDEAEDPESDSQALFVPSQQVAPPTRSRGKAAAKAPAKAAAKSTAKAAAGAMSTRAAAGTSRSNAVRATTGSGRQTQLSFGASQLPSAPSRASGRNNRPAAPQKKLQEPSEDEISDDDDDAFAPLPATTKGKPGPRR